MTAGPRLAWIDGRIVSLDQPVVRADDSAFTLGLGCYTTARFERGQVVHGARAARRLARDALSLGLGKLEAEWCLDGMRALGEAVFGAQTAGVVRFQASQDADGGLHLVGTTRALGSTPELWRAISSDWRHGGPGPAAGAKVSNHLLFAAAARAARRAGADEALLFDAKDCLVEGARTNLVWVSRGEARTPPAQSGVVCGVAREILLERGALVEGPVTREEVWRAGELVAVNAVRGAHPIVRLDGEVVGGGEAGPVAARLARILAEEE